MTLRVLTNAEQAANDRRTATRFRRDGMMRTVMAIALRRNVEGAEALRAIAQELGYDELIGTRIIRG